MKQPVASITELQLLHKQYLAMRDTPCGHWDQQLYEQLVLGLIHHAPDLLGMVLPTSNDWLETLSGKQFRPFAAEPEFTLEDLVWGCARVQRYNGQFKPSVEFYSVAEHLVLMTEWLLRQVPEDLGLTGQEHYEAVIAAACHDLQEGLIGDMVRPLKKQDPFYTQLENHLCGVISKRYGPKFPLPSIVKELDNRILVDERAQIMTPSGNTWSSDGLEPLGITVRSWSPHDAARELFYLLARLGIHD